MIISTISIYFHFYEYQAEYQADALHSATKMLLDYFKQFQALKNPHFDHFYHKNSQKLKKIVVSAAKIKSKNE